MTWEALDQTWHYVEKWAHEKPDEEALVFEDERLTWAQFKELMDLTARALLDLGVKRGDRVAMLSMARNDFPIIYMAAGKVGAVWMGLTPKYSLDELRYQVKDARPKVLFALNSYMGMDLTKNVHTLIKECPFIKKTLMLEQAVDGIENYRDFIQGERESGQDALDERAAKIKSEDETLLLYTSGSTGKPKGVVHTHHGIVENIRAEVEYFEFKEGARALLHFPINHVAAAVEIGFASIFGGATLVCMDRFDPAGSLKTIQDEGITVIGQVPVMFLLQMKQPEFFQTDLSSVTQFAWAGAAAPKIMMDALTGLAARTGARLSTGYGSTEVCGFVTYTAADDDTETLLKSAGRIADPFELKIVDKGRREVADGEVGEIAVRGPFLMKGYLNMPDETDEVIDEQGWYYTGDLACKDERGYIYISGRQSEMYKSGGENIHPREVEDAIELHDSILFAAVIPVPDEIFQEVGWAFAMLIPGKTATEDELKAWCKERLANFKVPKRFFVRPLLPVLPTGKVDKMALKQEVKDMLEKEA